jgi:sec-independent protein translocase protein TatA
LFLTLSFMTSSLLFLGDIGGSELILIMVVILIFFGANKIPELARGLGKGIREFKDASSEIRNEFENAGQNRPAPYQPQPQNPYPNQYGAVPGAPVAGPTDQQGYGHPYTQPYPQAYNANDAVNSPTAPPVSHSHDTPLPTTVPGTPTRLDQPSPDA